MSARIRMSNKPQPKPNTQKPTKKKNNRRSRRLNKRKNTSWIAQSFAPTTVGTTSKIYSRLTQRGNTARLDYSELFPVIIPSSGVSNLIFINPAKWINTRTYDQARLYTQFRPQFLHAMFISNVATSTPGLFSFGSYYASSHPDYTDDLFLRLPQTEGGFITSIWQTARTSIRCGTALSQNKYSLQEITSEDIPITLVCTTSNVPGQPGDVVGYVALTGAFLLTGPRTTKEDQNVSGDYSGPITIENNQCVLQVEDRFHCFAPDQELSLKTTDVNTTQQLLLTDANGLSIDFKKIFKVFVTVLGKVVSVVGTVVKIALAVAPLILADANGVTATGVSLTTAIVGKLPEGSVDLDQPTITTPKSNIYINYPASVIMPQLITDSKVTFCSINTKGNEVSFELQGKDIIYQGDVGYYLDTEKCYVSPGDTNWHSQFLNVQSSRIDLALPDADYKFVINGIN